MSACTTALCFSMLFSAGADVTDVGNRLTYLDAFCDPYYVGLDTPKLTTPQWIGEEGVDAVIVLAIDDLREAEQHEKFLRPIFERLKKIDGRAAVSLMTNRVDPKHSLVKRWFKEGVNLDAHTDDHPCPCLQGSDLAKAKAVFDRNVDALSAVPGARPVGYRMPCCDSMNSVSPRFFTEIFNKRTPRGEFLSMDSSVFHVFTANDPELPRSLVLDDDDREKFRKYVPTDRLMVNLVEDYPYPYVIGRLCWEICPVMPSDWDAQHLNGKCSPTTVRDLKAAVDAAAKKLGVFSICFHAHGWINNGQMVDVIDYAVTKHRGKVKFLNFHEVQERLDEHLLGGNPIRATNGQDNGVRLVDLNGDRFIDVVVAGGRGRRQRIWSPTTNRWSEGRFPVGVVDVDSKGNRRDAGVRFGVLKADGFASILVRNERVAGVWHFDGQRWAQDPNGLDGLEIGGPVYTALGGRDRGVRLCDLDRDGICEVVVGNDQQQGVFRWSNDRCRWLRLPFSLPEGTAVVDARGRDAGLRFVDLDEDGFDDVVFSNAKRYGAHLFHSMADGWSRTTLEGRRGDPDALPMIVRADGTNNGAWFSGRHMWVQNEDTGKKLPDHVDSRHFTDDFLAVEKEPRPPRSSLRSKKP
ncbi:MAG: FG-GAP-like repeat-containing protein [Planctomycetota bacterium]|jgi:hypothetical protein